jgi:hypothetical protein
VKLPLALVEKGVGSDSCGGLYLDFEAKVTETGNEAASGGLFIKEACLPPEHRVINEGIRRRRREA